MTACWTRERSSCCSAVFCRTQNTRGCIIWTSDRHCASVFCCTRLRAGKLVPRRIVEGVVLVLLGVYLFGHTLPHAWRSLNTDFPNYYLAARVTREGVDPSRAYEWIWLQREKDHRAIDQRIVGLVPITPFSTLAIWPLTGMAPLAAKHAWLFFNLLVS